MADNIQISIMNRSTVITDDQLKAAVPDLQIQISKHYAPIWGKDALLFPVGLHDSPYADTWWVVISDTSDEASALGYHETTPDGNPLAKVFAKSDIQYGENWTVTASHEILEMLTDPWINQSVVVMDNNNSTGMIYALEVCDSPEGKQYAYQVNNTWVSDFVYPAWFEYYRTINSTQFDYMKYVTKPFQILPNGYIGVIQIGSSTGWKQIYADNYIPTSKDLPKIGSRRERRIRPREQWQKSTAN